MRKNNFLPIVIAAVGFMMFLNIFESNNSSTKVDDVQPASVKKDSKKGLWPFMSNKQDITEIGNAALRNNIYVVFDGSGSMGDIGCSGSSTKADAAKQALLSFSEKIPADTNLGMLVFDHSGTRETVTLSVANKDKFSDEVKAVYPSQGTPLKTAITKAYKKLTAQAKKQQGYGNYHLVVVTDGDASTSEDPTYIVNEILDESPIVFHTIGFCIKERHTLNQPGRIIYKSAMNVKDLQTGLSNVLAEAPSFVATDFN